MFRLRDLFFSSASLVASQVITAAVGFAFWLIAAHEFTQTEVGIASAVISGISLVGAIGVMGLGTLLINNMPGRPGQEMGMIAASLIASTVFGAILGLAFVAAAPLLSSELDTVQATGVMVVTVAIGAGLTSASLVIDQAVFGIMRSGLQLVRNLVAAIARLILLVAFGLLAIGSGSLAIVGAFVASLFVSMLAMGLYSAQRRSLRRAYPLHWDFLNRERGSALRHHLLNLAIQVPGWAMPIIAVAVLSARTNAGFYFAWLLVGLASFVTAALPWALYAYAVREPDSIARWGWVSLRISAASALLGTIGLWVLGPFVLQVVGRGYADVARDALLVLPLTLFPLVVKNHYITIHRVRGTVMAAAGLVSFGAALEIVGGFVGATLNGLTGLGVGLLLAMVLESIPMMPLLVSTIIRPQFAQRSPQA